MKEMDQIEKCDLTVPGKITIMFPQHSTESTVTLSGFTVFFYYLLW